MSPEAVSEGPFQGTQRELQPDDPLLQKTNRAAFSTFAGAPCLCFSLLFCHAGWRPMCPLGLEELRQPSRISWFWMTDNVGSCRKALYFYTRLS